MLLARMTSAFFITKEKVTSQETFDVLMCPGISMATSSGEEQSGTLGLHLCFAGDLLCNLEQIY